MKNTITLLYKHTVNILKFKMHFYIYYLISYDFSMLKKIFSSVYTWGNPGSDMLLLQVHTAKWLSNKVIFQYKLKTSKFWGDTKGQIWGTKLS